MSTTKRLRLLLVVLVVVVSGLAIPVARAAHNSPVASRVQGLFQQGRLKDHSFFDIRLQILRTQLQAFDDMESAAEVQVVTPATIQRRLTTISRAENNDHFETASTLLASAQQELSQWQKAEKLAKVKAAIARRAILKQEAIAQALATKQSAEAAAQQAAAAAAALAATKAAEARGLVQLPIVLYHLTPPDFETQLQYLAGHGYVTITPDQLVAGLENPATLPPKPILLTFDDGLEDQMTAFGLLQKYHMRATFYIIDGGAASDYHIGANRHVPDPQGGYDYLTWDQIRQLDQSGLITIGSHTVDHLDLAQQSPDVQQFEIASGKSQLEAQLGHSVDSFAYPYGSYNATTLALVAQAGFTSAVTTTPGTIQSRANLLTLDRIRTVIGLP